MWRQFNKGQSIGERGSESGIILRILEHDDGARVTLEREGYTPFSITCGIYGWMAHTAFFASEYAAQKSFEQHTLMRRKPYETSLLILLMFFTMGRHHCVLPLYF